jgi:hypothetical protein
VIIAEIPRISKMFAVVEPMMFPTAIPVAPVRTE